MDAFNDVNDGKFDDEYERKFLNTIESMPVDKENIKIEPLKWDTCASPLIRKVLAEDNIKKEVLPIKIEINEDDKAVRSNLKLNWSHINDCKANEPSGWDAPRAYEYKDVYQVKKEKMIRQREEEERKARQFHSRPVPNFKALHKQMESMKVIHKITVPVTPETVKHSVADRDRRKQKDQESQGRIQQHQSMDDMKVARKDKLEAKPFQLRADQRVRDRREFDAASQNIMAQKKKEKDEQRKQQELEEQKELRKLTEFRARPNPFK